MIGTARSVTLHGTLHGPNWWPSGQDCQLPVTVDLTREAARFINATGSGLIDAVRAAVDGAGDFRSARLTADSYIVIERHSPTLRGSRSRSRLVEVTDLPSIADYVVANVRSDGPEG